MTKPRATDRRTLKDFLTVADGRSARRWIPIVVALLSVGPAVRRLASQSPQSLDSLTLRFARFTAVSGFEQAVADSLITLLPGSRRDRVGNVTLTLGSGDPRRLVSCPLDEAGFVVGDVTDDGYLTLRRVGFGGPLFDQQLEGQRVTLFGVHGAVPGVVGVRSTHLTRGRTANDAPFTVDNAYVDVGAASATAVAALGLRVLTPVALTKRPVIYARGTLVAGPAAERRASCAALAHAVLTRPAAKGTVIVAFTVQGLQSGNPGRSSVLHLQGPFTDTLTVSLERKYPNTAAETVSFADVDSLTRRIDRWIGGHP